MSILSRGHKDKTQWRCLEACLFASDDTGLRLAGVSLTSGGNGQVVALYTVALVALALGYDKYKPN